MPEQKTMQMVQSYTRVRLALGVLGLVLPFILIFGGMLDDTVPGGGKGGIEPTISDFYHTTYRDIFVGSLCAMGVFLLAYRGYPREPDEWVSDNFLSKSAGLAAFGLAFFPNDGGNPDFAVTALQNWVGVGLSAKLHYTFAFVFFVSLAAFCFYKFSKTKRGKRRWIYKACGWGIVAALVLTAIAVIFKQFVGGAAAEWVVESSIIFYFEALGVWAFAISWIVKSRADLSLVERVRKTTRRH